MFDFTIFSKKTPKTRRPEEKNEYTLTFSLRKTPIILDKKKKVTIGRSSKNTIVLKEHTISEKHAVIKWDKSGFKITDERSTNGTFLNNKRIASPSALKNGDRIKIGKFVLKFGVKKIREKKEANTPQKKKARSAKKSVSKPKAKSKPARKKSVVAKRKAKPTKKRSLSNMVKWKR
jgi:pSer/pThr/pTyr-binding forkhead associated (FHA) protein